jgi:hypothetical protein
MAVTLDPSTVAQTVAWMDAMMAAWLENEKAGKMVGY